MVIDTLIIEKWPTKRTSSSDRRSSHVDVLSSAGHELGLQVMVRDAPRFADFLAREALPNELLLTLHSIGYAPNVYRIKPAYVKPYYYFDRTGFSGWSELALNEQLQRKAISEQHPESTQYVQELVQSLSHNNSSKYTQPSSTAEKIEKEFIFVALQKPGDNAARLAYFDQFKLLDTVLELAQSTNLKFIIKRHPKCKDAAIKDHLNKLSKISNITLSSASIHDLIPRCSRVLTTNSGVGFEALFYSKPVLCTGRSDYSFVCDSARTVEELKTKLLSPPPVVNTNNINSFLYFFLTKYCFKGDDVSSAKNLLSQATGKDAPMLPLEIQNWIELARNENLSVSHERMRENNRKHRIFSMICKPVEKFLKF